MSIQVYVNSTDALDTEFGHSDTLVFIDMFHDIESPHLDTFAFIESPFFESELVWTKEGVGSMSTSESGDKPEAS